MSEAAAVNPAGTGLRFLELGPRIRRYLLLALIVALPITVAFGSGLRDQFNTPKVALLIIGVTIVGSIRCAEIIQGASLSGLGRLAVPALCFSIPFFLAWLASPDRGYSLSGADYGRYQGLIPYLLAVALGVLVADAFAGRAHQVVWALGVAGTIVAGIRDPSVPGCGDPRRVWWVMGLHGHLDSRESQFHRRFHRDLSLRAMAPFCMEKGARVDIARAMVYVMAIGLGRSFTQGAWAAGVAGVAVAMGAVLVRKWRWTRTAGTIVAVLIALGTVGVALVSLTGLEYRVLSTARIRALTWETALRATEAEPLLGHGLNTFGEIQSDFTSEEAVTGSKGPGTRFPTTLIRSPWRCS